MKIVVLIASFSFLVSAQAQLFTIEDVSQDDVTLSVESGFNPSYYWNNFADPALCPWSEYRTAIDSLNPQYAADGFRNIPIGGTFVVSATCTVSEAYQALPFTEEFLLDEEYVAVSTQEHVVELGSESLLVLTQLVTALENSSQPTSDQAQTNVASANLQGNTPPGTAAASTNSYWQLIALWPYWIYVAGALLFLLILSWVMFPRLARRKRHQDFHAVSMENMEIAKANADLKRQLQKKDVPEKSSSALESELASLKKANQTLLSQRNSANSRYGHAQRKLNALGEGTQDSKSKNDNTSEGQTPAQRKRRGGSRQKRAVAAKKKKESDIES